MNHKVNLNIIYRYLAGECTAEEKQRILRWMNADPENREIMQSIQRIWSVEPRKETESDIQLAWKHLEERLEQREQVLTTVERRPGRFPIRKSGPFVWYRVAAVFMVIAVTTLYAALNFSGNPDPEPLAMNEVVTEKGQRAQLVLDDGSRVRLNADSKITHPKEFGAENRVVQLSGEAYFEIVRDGRPFFVHADDAVIEILGTEFNVLAYEEEEIQVVVSGGKVSVRHQDANESNAAFLERGDMASLKRGGNELPSVTHNVDLERHLGWLDYRLEFDATPLEKVAKRLERWYEMDITLADPSLSDLRFTAVFEDESIDEVLDALQLSLDLEYEIQDRQITFFREDEGVAE